MERLRSVAPVGLLCCTSGGQDWNDIRGASVSNPLWSRPGVTSVGIAVVLWAILLVVIIEAGRLTSLW